MALFVTDVLIDRDGLAFDVEVEDHHRGRTFRACLPRANLVVEGWRCSGSWILARVRPRELVVVGAGTSARRLLRVARGLWEAVALLRACLCGVGFSSVPKREAGRISVTQGLAAAQGLISVEGEAELGD